MIIGGIMEKPIYYSILPSQVRYDKNLSANEKILYSEIVVLAQKKGYCFAQNEFFAELFAVSKNTVSRWIVNLEKWGFIKCQMTYIDGTKWITGRKIYPKRFEEEVSTQMSPPSAKNDHRGINKNDDRGIHKNEHSPIHKNYDYNNTRYINTSMNKTRTILSSFNSLGGRVKVLEENEENLAKIQRLLDEYGETILMYAIEEIRKSKFLRGEVSDFVVNLDYLRKPANMEKITGGKYRDFDNDGEVSYEIPYEVSPVKNTGPKKSDYLQKLLDRI